MTRHERHVVLTAQATAQYWANRAWSYMCEAHAAHAAGRYYVAHEARRMAIASQDHAARSTEIALGHLEAQQ